MGRRVGFGERRGRVRVGKGDGPGLEKGAEPAEVPGAAAASTIRLSCHRVRGRFRVKGSRVRVSGSGLKVRVRVRVRVVVWGEG